MLPITEIKAEGEPAAGGSGRSGTVSISGSFPGQTLASTHYRVSGLPSHLILLGASFVNTIKCMEKVGLGIIE